MVNRRTVLGAGAAGLVGTGVYLYRSAPAFWDQYARELNRAVEPAPLRPDPRNWPDQGLHAAWLGHSSVLLKIDGYTILTDPIFSVRAGIHLLGPLTIGVKRLRAPALGIDELPPVDLILLSHAHMDHFDLPSLRALESRRTRVITARKTSDLLRAGQYRQVSELGWSELDQSGPAAVRGVEVNHWGARVRTDTYRGYGGYLIESGRYSVLFAGDTANTHTFYHVAGGKQVDLAIMPVGAYNPWIRAHCNPEQAWRMCEDARAEHVLPIHHSTFQLSQEPLNEPIA